MFLQVGCAYMGFVLSLNPAIFTILCYNSHIAISGFLKDV